MNNKRYLVRGKRINTGEWIKGYYDEDDFGVYIRIRSDEGYSLNYDVDPATIESVVVKVIKQKTLVGDYICPNCKAAFIDGMDTTPYCYHCGQRLDWKVEKGVCLPVKITNYDRIKLMSVEELAKFLLPDDVEYMDTNEISHYEDGFCWNNEFYCEFPYTEIENSKNDLDLLIKWLKAEVSNE